MIEIKRFPFHLRIFLELPLISIRTSIMCESYTMMTLEILCYEIRIWKWMFSIQITSDYRLRINNKSHD